MWRKGIERQLSSPPPSLGFFPLCCSCLFFSTREFPRPSQSVLWVLRNVSRCSLRIFSSLRDLAVVSRQNQLFFFCSLNSLVILVVWFIFSKRRISLPHHRHCHAWNFFWKVMLSPDLFVFWVLAQRGQNRFLKVDYNAAKRVTPFLKKTRKKKIGEWAR